MYSLSSARLRGLGLLFCSGSSGADRVTRTLAAGVDHRLPRMPRGHVHQTFLWLPNVTSSGVRGRFRAVSHCESNSALHCSAQNVRNVCRSTGCPPSRKKLRSSKAGRSSGTREIACRLQPAVIADSPSGEALDPYGFASPPFGGFAKIFVFEMKSVSRICKENAMILSLSLLVSHYSTIFQQRQGKIRF